MSLCERVCVCVYVSCLEICNRLRESVCVRMCLLWEHESGLTSQLFFDWEQVVLLAQQEVALSLLVSNLCQQFVLLCPVCRFGNEVLNLQDRCWARCVSVCLCVRECVRVYVCAYVSCLGI